MSGYAAVFNKWTDLYKGRYLVHREVIRPGAFSAALSEKQDVRLLFNHNVDYILGRTRAGTLRLAEHSGGLWFESSLLDSGWNRDRIIGPAKRGDLSGMSFAFTIRPGGIKSTQRHEGDVLVVEDEITAANLFDVSIVTDPAYMDAGFSLSTRNANQRHRAFLIDSAVRLMELEAAT